MKGKKGLGLTGKILIGLVLGVICGVIINVSGLAENKVINKYIIDGILAIVGGGFISAIKMMMVPVVFFSLVVGAASIGEVSRLGRIGIKTLSFYMVTTALAIAISLGVGLLISPGLGGGIDLSDKATLETVSEALPLFLLSLSFLPFLTLILSDSFTPLSFFFSSSFYLDIPSLFAFTIFWLYHLLNLQLFLFVCVGWIGN